MKKFKQFFEGKLSLAQSFWIWLVLANLAFQLAIMLLGQLGLFLTYLLFISKIVYEVFAIIGVWRSATNYIKKKKTVYWGWLAKISAIGYALEVLVFTYILLVPVIGDFKAQNFKPKKEKTCPFLGIILLSYKIRPATVEALFTGSSVLICLFKSLILTVPLTI